MTAADPDLIVPSRDGARIAAFRSGLAIGPPLLLIHGASADHTTLVAAVFAAVSFTAIAADAPKADAPKAESKKTDKPAKKAKAKKSKKAAAKK